MEREEKIELATNVIRDDGIIGYPTEGVWGLGCNPFSEKAVERLLRLKKRTRDKGLLLVASEIDQFFPFLEGLEQNKLAQLDKIWPGPVSFLVPDNGVAPEWIVGANETLGLRVSAHPEVKSLCDQVGPLVSTSANITGFPPVKSAEDFLISFEDEIDYVLEGRLGGLEKPTEIRHIITGEVFR